MKWLQRWTDVLFFHYPVEREGLANLLPPRLEVDTYAGEAWISFVLFRMSLRPAWLPHLPGFSSLTELNVRTYVRHRGQSGIYFLRMYADNPWAIRAAGWLTPLDYKIASLHYSPASSADWQGTGTATQDLLDFRFSLQQTGHTESSASGTLDEWLLERYRLFVGGRGGSLIAAEVEHDPWQAAALTGEFAGGSRLVSPLLLASAAAPRMHCSPGVSAIFRQFRPVEGAADFNSDAAIQPAHATAARAVR
jgi:uncharacterized protein